MKAGQKIKKLQEKRINYQLVFGCLILNELIESAHVLIYTCLFNIPPETDMQEELNPKTGFTNLINIWILCSFVFMLCVLNITIGLLESEFHENISM